MVHDQKPETIKQESVWFPNLIQIMKNWKFVIRKSKWNFLPSIALKNNFYLCSPKRKKNINKKLNQSARYLRCFEIIKRKHKILITNNIQKKTYTHAEFFISVWIGNFFQNTFQTTNQFNWLLEFIFLSIRKQIL